jgi:hypothetical protein
MLSVATVVSLRLVMLPSRMARWLSLCQASGCPQKSGLFNPSLNPLPVYYDGLVGDNCENEPS